MKQSITLAGLLSLAMLVACSKPAPTPAGEGKDAGPAAAAEPEATKPRMGRAEYVAKVLPLISTAPECQQFRDQLEQVGKAPTDELSPTEMNQVNEIVGKALETGCKSKQ